MSNERISYVWPMGNWTPEGLILPGQSPEQSGWAGPAASANIFVFFTQGHRPIVQAWWFATLIPNKGGARLVAYDDSDYVITELARTPFTGETNPRPLGAFIQEQLNAEIARGKVYRYIGVQVCGDARLFSSIINVQV